MNGSKSPLKSILSLGSPKRQPENFFKGAMFESMTSNNNAYMSINPMMQDQQQRQLLDESAEVNTERQPEDTGLNISAFHNNDSIMVMINEDNGNNKVNEQSEETVLPSQQSDALISMEDALLLVQGSPDNYTWRAMYLISNLLSTTGFMLFLSVPFLFQEPKVQCFNEEVNMNFRCSAQQACQSYGESYKLDNQTRDMNFISQYDVLCSPQNMNSMKLNSILASVIIVSQILTGILMDRFGRKKVIAIKATLSLIALIPLIPLGFMHGANQISAVLTFYVTGLLFCTFSFDLMLFGFENLPKNTRDNYIIVLASTRILGIGAICLMFYFTNCWVYFIILECGLLCILIPLFIKYVHESPLQVMVATADLDQCKFILNSIAVINEELIVNDKIHFSHSPLEAQQRRSIKFIFKNSVNDPQKMGIIGLVSVCWITLALIQMFHFVFLERIQMSLQLDVLILGSTQFLASLFSKVMFKSLSRKTSLIILYSFLAICIFLLMAFSVDNTQTKYVVTISSRAALQILYNILTTFTLEQFPTETRATSQSMSISIGYLIGGLGFSFIGSSITNNLMVAMLMVILLSIITVVFLRETKTEEALMNFYEDIFKPVQDLPVNNIAPPVQEIEKEENPVFNSLLNQLGGLAKEGSKLGTLVGSPRNHFDIKLDFEMPPGYNLKNALQFENSLIPHTIILEEDNSNNSSSSEDDKDNSPEELQDLESSLDEDDYEELDEGNESNIQDRYEFQYGFSLPGENEEQPIDIDSDQEEPTNRPFKSHNSLQWALDVIDQGRKMENRNDEENFRITEDGRDTDYLSGRDQSNLQKKVKRINYLI